MSSNDEAEFGKANKAAPCDGNDKPGHWAEFPISAFSIDDIMWRVRGEVTRRRNGLLTSVTVPSVPAEVRSFDLATPRWKPSVPRLPIKDTYQLAELLAYSDADFIDSAYRAILRRPPDEVGFSHFLRLLRASQATRLDIVTVFLSSPEGKSKGVHVEGLYLPTLLQKWRRKRLVGPIIAWLYGFACLGKQGDRQANLEVSQARELQELGRILNEASEHQLQRTIALRIEFAGRVASDEFERLKSEHAAEISTVAAAMSRLEGDVRARILSCEEHLNRMRTVLDSTTRFIEQLQPSDEQYDLENRFHGDRSLVRFRAKPYLDYVREAHAGTPDAPILDLGCGRGEWLELLRECGLAGRGIEINSVFVNECRELGLEVEEGDAYEILRGLPDQSVGAVTALHMIEHLPFERGIALLNEIRRVLRPGGLIVLESANPENLSISHHLIYMDSTHRSVLQPGALRWIVEALGYHDVRINRLVLEQEHKAASLFPAEAPGADSLNALLTSMNASRDYAIVAKRI